MRDKITDMDKTGGMNMDEAEVRFRAAIDDALKAGWTMEGLTEVLEEEVALQRFKGEFGRWYVESMKCGLTDDEFIELMLDD